MKNNILQESLDVENKAYKENSGISIKDANLGQVGQILDLVVNYQESQKSSLKEIYCNFLNCDESKLTCDTKDFCSYKKRVIIYTLFKDKGYQYKSLLNKENSIDKDISSSYSKSYHDDYNDFQLINISANKTVRIPTAIHLGVQKGNNNFIIKTVSDYNYFGIKFFYKKGNEKLIDNFYNYLIKQIDLNNFYKSSKITPDLDFLNLKDLSWKDIILDKKTKDKLVYNIIDFFEKEEIYKKNGISTKCGLIWEGPPGTGKTLAAQILAKQLKDITFIWVTPDDLTRSCDVKKIYTIAKDLKPSIVFFEDADLFCTQRGSTGDHTILGEIMNQLDGLIPLEGVVTIFTTNDPGAMEQAIIDRPGRFDERIEFLPPKKNGIIKIMKKCLNKPEYDKSSLDEIAENSEDINLTGAHIKRLCDLATIYAIKDNSINDKNIAIIKKDHFNQAFDNIKNMRIKAGNKISFEKKTVSTTMENIKNEHGKIKIDENKKNRFRFSSESVISNYFK